MQEARRIEDSLREQLLHRGKKVQDTGFDGLLRAFDLFDEGPARASKETQTDAVKFLELASGNQPARELAQHKRDGSKQVFVSMMP